MASWGWEQKSRFVGSKKKTYFVKSCNFLVCQWIPFKISGKLRIHIKIRFLLIFFVITMFSTYFGQFSDFSLSFKNTLRNFTIFEKTKLKKSKNFFFQIWLYRRLIFWIFWIVGWSDSTRIHWILRFTPFLIFKNGDKKSTRNRNQSFFKDN